MPVPLPSTDVHPVGPDAATWAAMSPKAREEFLDAVNAFHSDPVEAMSEGRPHKRAKNEVLDTLGLHFSRLGRVVYLADEMSVMYPGERTFVPDILAVVDVPQPDDDPRQAWVVLDEGRGLDLVIEVLNTGDRRKDLVRNVEWYARLGIPEYFVYDRRNQRLFGWRLPDGGDTYVSLKPEAGRLPSVVLGLELAIVEGHLRFYTGHSELYGSATLLSRLAEMVDSVETRADAAEQALEVAERAREAAEQERATAEQQRATAEQQRATAEQQRATAEQERATAEQQRATALASLRAAVLTILAARGLAVPDAVRGALEAEAAPEVLARLAARAAVIERTDLLFA